MKSLKMNLRWLLTACAMAAVCAMICLAPTARAAGGEVSGCAYVDANENLVHDESEQLITGVPVRLERLEQRGGPGCVQRFLERWIPLEDRYFAACKVKECCQIQYTGI